MPRSSPPEPAGEGLSGRAWDRLTAWYRTAGRHSLPWRQGRTPWNVFVAETLLHRTRADQTAARYGQAVLGFDGPADVLAKSERWLELTHSAGLFWRAQKFVEACEVLCRTHEGTIPCDRQALMKLPGVGHYVADAVLCFGCGQPSTIVDTNTQRVAGRVLGRRVDPTSHRRLSNRSAVAELVGPEIRAGAEQNWALLDLAALVCTPRQPLCESCPILQSCVTGRDWQSDPAQGMIGTE